MITLVLKQPVDGVPLEAESICPDTVSALDNAAIRALPVFLGKRQCRIDDFFTVDGEESDASLTLYDPYLVVYDGTSIPADPLQCLVINDDEAATVSSQIDSVSIAAGASITIAATSYDDSTSGWGEGTFSLTLTRL